MKKVLLLAFIALSISSCTSNTGNSKEQIVQMAETKLKSDLKDPASYQLIKSGITDTVFASTVYMKIIYDDSLEVEANKSDTTSSYLQLPMFESEIKVEKDRKKEAIITSKKNLQDAKNNFSELKKDSIQYINVYLNYRAKNGFGALDVYDKKLYYYPSKKSLEYASKD